MLQSCQNTLKRIQMPVEEFLLQEVQSIFHIPDFFLDEHIANNAVGISILTDDTLLIPLPCSFKESINHIFSQNLAQLLWCEIPLIVTHELLQLIWMDFNLEVFGN